VVNKNGSTSAGDPINVATGNMYVSVIDYKTAGPNPLFLERYYNSMGVTNAPSAQSNLGANWRTNFDRSLVFTPATGTPTSVVAVRPDGQGITFTASGSNWVTESDVDYTLTQNGTTWTLRGPDDATDTYNSSGKVTTITQRNGYTWNLTYGTAGNLATVTDSYNRVLTFTPNSNNLIGSVATPDGTSLTYGYTVGTGMIAGISQAANRLTTVGYSTTPATSQTYLYGNSSYPFAMTGIMDENNNQYATWSYDTAGRGASSQHGTGGNLTTLVFNSNGTTTVTNPFGVADTYSFTTLQNVPKVSEISRAATSTTAAATRTFGYDSNGYLNSETDWNANETTFVNNTQGNPTTINYAVGSAVAFTKTISYDPTFIRLPHQIITPGLTSTFAYDTLGNPLTRTDLDTTTNSVPYSTNGQSRVTTYTWSATGQETSIKLPRTDVTAKTTFGYDTTGALTTITDALSHQTKVTSHTGGGYPLTVVDPNSVTSTMTYDARQNLHTYTIDTTAGNLTTTWNWDPAQYLDSVVKPDGSTLTFGYDTAHRLTSITDLLNNNITYTLDDLGNATLIEAKNSSGVVTYEHSADFDALGRLTSDIGGMNQTTTFTYDPQGNNLTITPPSPSGEITQTFDALNRLSTRVDPTPGGTTTIGYDAHNRILSVEDANSHTTTNVFDGFGERTQTASPDSGTTIYHYDLDSNLSEEQLPGSLTANYTYDALDRNLAVKYTGDSTLNVTNTYDQTGHGFGVGHLTSSTDQIGSLSLSYDERGNRTTETRTPSGVTAFTTTYGYDAASNIASITYPSTTLVQYGRDTMGKVTSVTAKPPGASSATNIATSIGYEPFGPVSSLTYGNGITGTYAFDLDYRATTRLDKGSTTVSSLAYGYFNNNSVQTITDSVHTANTQTLGYDSMDHLISATSGSGGYGTLDYTWDGVSNLKTQTVNGTGTTYNYTTGTNQLSTFVTGSTTETAATTAQGNISSLKVGSTTVQAFTYNKANELASASNGSSSATYAYDLFGRRAKGVGTVSGTSYYEYDPNNNLLENRNSSGVTQADYIYLEPKSGPGATPLGTYQPSTAKIYYLHTDRLGTPQSATDSTETVQWTTTYQPFGKTGTITGSVVQQLRLPGQEYDADSALNHNGFRDYAVGLTRYVQTDPIGLGGGMNTYQYVDGNPFKNIDPTGLQQQPPYHGYTPPGADPNLCAQYACVCATAECAAGLPPVNSEPGPSLMCEAKQSATFSALCFGLTMADPVLGGLCKYATSFIPPKADKCLPTLPSAPKMCAPSDTPAVR
jgi:RHS repeat-associated protein